MDGCVLKGAGYMFDLEVWRGWHILCTLDIDVSKNKNKTVMMIFVVMAMDKEIAVLSPSSSSYSLDKECNIK